MQSAPSPGKTANSIAALLYGPREEPLGMLASLCDLLAIPLVATEERIASLASKYYPHINVELLDYSEVAQTLLSRYNVVFSTLTRQLFDEAFCFAKKWLGKPIHTIWCPYEHTLPRDLKHEEAMLAFGKKMVEELIDRKLLTSAKEYVLLGNLQAHHYAKHKASFDALASREVVRKLAPSRRTLLTDDPSLADSFPKEDNLIIYGAKDHFEQTDPHILFVPASFPLYPLFDLANAYIGNGSSLAYEFLSCNKPMFFSHPVSKELSSCGPLLSASADFSANFSKHQKEASRYIFAEHQTREKVKHQLLELCSLLLKEQDLDFI
jgi:hypothetical protein